MPALSPETVFTQPDATASSTLAPPLAAIFHHLRQRQQARQNAHHSLLAQEFTKGA
jgi:hypothetical protein